jgi:hypothetical protein
MGIPENSTEKNVKSAVFVVKELINISSPMLLGSTAYNPFSRIFR